MLLSIIGVGFSCQENEKSTSVVLEKKKPASSSFPKASELALLMRKMYDDMDSLKSAIAKQELVIDTASLDYFNIHSAIPTDSTVRDAQFAGMSSAFLLHVEKLKANPDVETFNSTISVCLTCHQSYCPGPIKKIKKLKLKKFKPIDFNKKSQFSIEN